MPGPNRRREARIGIGLPVRVRGFDGYGTPWEEMTTTDDASSSGLSFALKRPIGLGQILQLSLPLPKRFRRFDPNTPVYTVYAQVRATGAAGRGRIGVALLGKNPPAGFGKPTRQRAERRRGKRGAVAMKVQLDHIGPDGLPRQSEHTLLEDFSRGGARVRTTMPLRPGDTVHVEELTDGAFQARAVVRASEVGADGIRRLGLQFLGWSEG